MWFKEENCSRTAVETMTLRRPMSCWLWLQTQSGAGFVNYLGSVDRLDLRLGPKKHCPVIPQLEHGLLRCEEGWKA